MALKYLRSDSPLDSSFMQRSPESAANTGEPHPSADSGIQGAVKMFTQVLAREIGNRGITVNNVQPGPIDSELNPATGD